MSDCVSRSSLLFKVRKAADEAAVNKLKDVARGLLIAAGYIQSEDAVPQAREGTRVTAYWAHEHSSLSSWLRCSQCNHKLYDNIWGEMQLEDFCPKCGSIMAGYVEQDGRLRNIKKETKDDRK